MKDEHMTNNNNYDIKTSLSDQDYKFHNVQQSSTLLLVQIHWRSPNTYWDTQWLIYDISLRCSVQLQVVMSCSLCCDAADGYFDCFHIKLLQRVDSSPKLETRPLCWSIIRWLLCRASPIFAGIDLTHSIVKTQTRWQSRFVKFFHYNVDRCNRSFLNESVQ